MIKYHQKSITLSATNNAVEHYDDFGLINMNGRMYDPLVGRMLSPDIVIQAPDNSQNFNRYAYCVYNPLKYVEAEPRCARHHAPATLHSQHSTLNTFLSNSRTKKT